jgi:serine/threonine protein kinase
MGQSVNESSDIYSCGCALFQALTGKPPFVGSNALTTLLMHQSDPIPRLSSSMNGRACPHALEELVTTMLAKSPEDRYQNVDEVLDFLLHIEKMDELGLEDFQEEQVKDAVEKWKKIGDEAEEEGDNEDQDENGDHSSRTKFAIAALGIALLSALSIVLITSFYFSSNTKQASLESKTTPISAEPIPRPRPRPAPSQIPEEFSDATEFPDETDFPDIQMDKLKKRLASPTYDKRLVVSQFAKLSDKTIELIASTSWIRNLTISRCEFNNQSLGTLKKLNLVRINLEHTKFNDRGAKSLSRCQTLQEIKAQSTDITNDGLKELSSITSLKILRLSKTIVTADGIRYLCKKNKNCTTIYLTDCRNITSEEIAKLRQEFHQVNFITDINAH